MRKVVRSFAVALAVSLLALAAPSVQAQSLPCGGGPFAQDSLIVFFNGAPVGNTTANTSINGVENVEFRGIFDGELEDVADDADALGMRIHFWFSVTNGSNVRWDSPADLETLLEVKAELEALPYVQSVEFDCIVQAI